MARQRNDIKYLKYWQKVLGIEQWTIGVTRDKLLFKEQQRLGEIMWTAERENALITLATDRQFKADHEDLEATVLHELLHIRIHGHLSMEEFTEAYGENEAEMNRLENTINALTQGFMKLKGEQNARI